MKKQVSIAPRSQSRGGYKPRGRGSYQPGSRPPTQPGPRQPYQGTARPTSQLTSYPLEVQLLIACKMGNIDQVKKLVEADLVDPSYDNNKPLERCCENGRDKIAEYLLTKPGVTFIGNSARELALQFGHTRCLSL